MVIDEENHGVIIAGFEIDAPDLIRGLNDSFGEEKSHHENFIIARGSHEDRERPAIDNDLQGLLNGYDIVVMRFFTIRPFGDPAGEGRLGHDYTIPNSWKISRDENSLESHPGYLSERGRIVAVFNEGGDAGDDVGFVFRVGDSEP
jgi:hypothetical protein